jgi:hypothetical protein|tara:strand:- start:509 stop:1057 length:549 start_codon:yes stop_codon:yes gene_type:complete
MDKKGIQRMRNLVSGNTSDKTKISTGYGKSRTVRSEGDTWETKGKTWTIKNGIRQTVSKLDLARETLRVPAECPKCGDSRMQHHAYKAMYKRFGMCFNCVIKFENGLRAAGKFEEFAKELSKSDNEAWLKDKTAEYYDWLSTMDSESYITEAGDVEDWSGGKSKKLLKQEFDHQVEKIKKTI